MYNIFVLVNKYYLFINKYFIKLTILFNIDMIMIGVNYLNYNIINY